MILIRRLTAMSLAAALAFVLAPSVARSCSQCMCGSLFPADALGTEYLGPLRFGLEERYLSKSNGLEDADGIEDEREHRISGFASWRPKPWLALRGSIPYNVKEVTERPTGGPEVLERESGIGDADLRAVARAAEIGAGSLSVLASVMAPTGSNDRENAEGERLDEHVQPGIGAWSGSAGLHWVRPAAWGLVDASLMGRANGENSHGYAYGNAMLFNAGYLSPMRSGWSLKAEVNGRTAKRDRNGGIDTQNTGGTVTYLAPGLRWVGAGGLGVEGEVQIPVYESLYGIQDEHTTARLSFSFGR